MVSMRSYLSSASARQVVESWPPEKRTSAVVCMAGSIVGLQEPFQQPARAAVQRLRIRDSELHPMRAGDQQRAALEAADVLLGLEHEARLAAVGAHGPGAGHAEARDLVQLAQRGREVARSELLRQQLPQGLGQLGHAVDPQQLA